MSFKDKGFFLQNNTTNLYYSLIKPEITLKNYFFRSSITVCDSVYCNSVYVDQSLAQAKNKDLCSYQQDKKNLRQFYFYKKLTIQ